MKNLVKYFAVSSLLLAMLSGYSVASANQNPTNNIDAVYVASQLGQPLRAVVLLEQGAAISTKMASSQAYVDRGLALPDLTKLKFDFVKEKARPFLRISSNAAFDNPAQTVLLEVTKNGITEVQEYALLVDLPGSQAESVPTTAEKFVVATAKSQVKIKPAMKMAKKIAADNKDVKINPADSKSFDAALTTINKRLDNLEKGQEQLVKQFAETDKKLIGLMEKVVAMSPSVGDKKMVDAALTQQTKPTVTTDMKQNKNKVKAEAVEVVAPVLPDLPASVTAKIEKVEKVEEKAQPSQSDKKKKDVAKVAASEEALTQMSVNITPQTSTSATVPPTTKVDKPVPTEADKSTVAVVGDQKMEVKKADPLVAAKAKKEFKPAPIIEEKSMQDQVLDNPLLLGGGLAGILALVGIPFFVKYRKTKIMANSTPEYTV